MKLRNKSIFSLCSCIAIAIVTDSLHAEIYRWVDDDGIVNFAQRRPLNTEAIMLGKPAKKRSSGKSSETINTSPLQSDQPAAQLKLSAEQREMYSALQEKEADRQAEINRIRASNCKRSRTLLQRLSANGRIRIRASDGDERNLPDEERIDRISQAQQAIVKNCNSG